MIGTVVIVAMVAGSILAAAIAMGVRFYEDVRGPRYRTLGAWQVNTPWPAEDPRDKVLAEALRIAAILVGLTPGSVKIIVSPESGWDYRGTPVSGNTGPGGKWIVTNVGLQSLCHELFHAFDLQTSGGTDMTHSSWGPRWPRIEMYLQDLQKLNP